MRAALRSPMGAGRPLPINRTGKAHRCHNDGAALTGILMDSHEAAVRIRVELGDSWLRFPERTNARPTRLFHYTSQEGLIGIVTSNVLRATNILYLNDSSEFAYGLSRARWYLDDMAERRSPGVVSEFLRWGERLLDLSALLPDRHFYAFCFCEKPDLLSQWRAYADRGGGYALGIDTEDIGRAIVKQNLSFFPVEYGSGQNAELLGHDIEALCGALSRCAEQWPGHDETLVSAACEHLKLLFIFRLFWMKHPGFAEEREWRIFANFNTGDLSRVHFRPTHGTLVPYVELDLSYPGGPEKLPIREVVHGPNAHPKLASQSLDWIFRKYGFPAPKISGSTIPLRSSRFDG